jgi:hypothetical protein
VKLNREKKRRKMAPSDAKNNSGDEIASDRDYEQLEEKTEENGYNEEYKEEGDEYEENSDYEYSSDEGEEGVRSRNDRIEREKPISSPPFYYELIHVQEEVKMALSWAVSISVLLFAILYYSFFTFLLVLIGVFACNNMDCRYYYHHAFFNKSTNFTNCKETGDYKKYYAGQWKFSCFPLKVAFFKCKNSCLSVFYYLFKSKTATTAFSNASSQNSADDSKVR